MRRLSLLIVAAILLAGGVAQAQMFDITNPGDPVVGVPNDNKWPAAEAPANAIDDNVATKYLCFKTSFTPDATTGGAGFRVTPSGAKVVVQALNFASANDAVERDPIAFRLSGSDDSIDGPYTVIAEGTIDDFDRTTSWARNTWISATIPIANRKAYTHYEVFFTDIRDRTSANSMQIAEVELLSDGTVPGLASAPTPADEATDVLRDVDLSWNASESATTHDVYLGTSFDDVNEATVDDPRDVLVSEGQTETTYDPEDLLAYGTTYYWRIDEVNGAPDYTVFKGEIWSFTTEPYSLQITDITATASSSGTDMGPEKTIDGSGLNDDDQHGISLTDTWMTDGSSLPAWIQYEFDKAYKLHEMWVWNSNGQIESFAGLGAKDVTVEYSVDGTTWSQVEDVPQFAQAPGTDNYNTDITVDFAGAYAKYVKLTITSNYSTMMAATGLSEVRFFYVPVWPRQPDPSDGETDVDVDTTLTWRAGREAASHDVCFGTDEQAVIDGTAATETVNDASYTPDGLVFGNIYYWKVTEVNDAEATPTWESGVWTFTTEEYGAIEDFESYNDSDNYIFDAWLDGYVDKSSGSQVGYIDSINGTFGETTIVNDGSTQSMPLLYNNVKSPYYSEAYRTWETAQDWTTNDTYALKLYFYGSTDNVAEPLYIGVKDSSNKSLFLTYDDPNAAITAAWQTWVIPLSTFTDAGVNMAKVKTMYIGLGSRTSPTVGGAGTIYIDDISRGTPLVYHIKGDVTSPGDAVLGVPNDSDWPTAEVPSKAFDNSTSTKFLHFKGEIQSTGVQVTPSIGATIVTELTFTTANDAEARDPASFEFYGSNDSITGPYTLITSGNIVDFTQSTAWARYTKNTTPITFENTVAYKHYQVLFPTVRDAANANSMQIGEIEMIGVQAK